MKSFQFARFALLTLMCYGEKLDEKTINDIEFANRSMIVYSKKLSVLVFLPAISNYIFHERVMTAIEMQQKQKELCVPLINVRKQHRMQQNDTKESYVCSYLDSLLNMKLPEEGEEKPNWRWDGNSLSQVSECWYRHNSNYIAAELVKHQEIQHKLSEEIESVVRKGEEIKEEDLQKMSYLKGLVSDWLRCYTPGH